jgi:dipeptidyl aminopeptidase/acylaminoacyl peptidase
MSRRSPSLAGTRLLALASAAAVAAAAAAAAAEPAATARVEPTLQAILGRDFVGTLPESPAWSEDGRAVYYQRRRPGTEIRDLFRVDVASGRTTRVEPEERARVDAAAAAVESRDRRLKAFVRDGDLFVVDRRRGGLRQLTRTAEAESDPLPLEGGRRVAFRRGDDLFVHDLESGTVSTLADLAFADDPDQPDPDEPWVGAQEERLFRVLAERKARREAARDERRARCARDPSCAPEPWYLGEGRARLASALSPDGTRLALVVGPERDRSEDEEQGADGGKADRMPVFVNESGYVEIRDVRPKVGTGKPESPRLLLLELGARERHELAYEDLLPGLREDPLAELRARAEAEAETAAARDRAGAEAAAEEPAEAAEAEAKAAKPRVVSIETLAWSDDSRRLAVQFFSYDNKDRWIAAVDAAAAAPRLEPLERLHDPAWIGWRFADVGWMRDHSTLWYQSEESGWGHLWLRPVGAGASRRALTSGAFEVDAPRLSRDGRSFLVEASREHPGVVELYRVDASSGDMTRLTERNGRSSAILSPDERRLLLTSSSLGTPPELYVQDARAGAPARRLTESASEAFRAVDWTLPEIVAIPSRHGAGNLWANLYKPDGWSPDRRWPAVVFIHGAGYLQNVDYGWPDYYREFMFHTLLARRGYLVLDIDYRASAGYGRAWRTAIYRQMGWPELEDLQDGVDWLVERQGADPTRVGAYGGSYGGFLVFMAMFRQPDLFAAGAALRPVSDWAHYNHGYTSNILNTPDVDPEAYRRSSPIEYAEGLARPLLICHGMVDDNVVFQDSVRLVQRLVELGKTDLFETAIYPVEPHGFLEPTSWYDEYRRIWNLFERTLSPGAG